MLKQCIFGNSTKEYQAPGSVVLGNYSSMADIKIYIEALEKLKNLVLSLLLF